MASSTDTVEGRFAGRTTVVTGAGSGIGRATALRLLREGARVIASDVSASRLAELAAEEIASDLVIVVGDLTEQSVVDEIVAAAGDRVHALANVAGIMDGFLPPAEVTDEVWERVLGVNLTAVMRLTRAVLPGMLAAGSGSVVTVSSEAGLRGSAAGAAYTTSKHALHGFTKSVAMFYRGKGIRANAVAPGGVATNIEASFRSEYAQQVLGPLLQTNVGAIATSEQLAATITWLLSDDASNVSGAIVPCDGGWAAI